MRLTSVLRPDATDHDLKMGRNKAHIPLSKKEKRLIREGKVSQHGRIFLDRGPRQELSTLDAVQAARTVRCASEASAGPRAKRPSCDK